MKYLLDTQIAIWSLENHSNLKQSTRKILEDRENTLYVSPISLIEISIKLKLGKLPQFAVSVDELTEHLLNDGFEVLPLELDQIFAYQSVPLYDDHRDPFDRMLLAIALNEQFPIISSDEKFVRYRPNISVLLN
jgi:PIN domain nuclease of toxin-antitoxin system